MVLINQMYLGIKHKNFEYLGKFLACPEDNEYYCENHPESGRYTINNGYFVAISLNSSEEKNERNNHDSNGMTLEAVQQVRNGMFVRAEMQIQQLSRVVFESNGKHLHKIETAMYLSYLRQVMTNQVLSELLKQRLMVLGDKYPIVVIWKRFMLNDVHWSPKKDNQVVKFIDLKQSQLLCYNLAYLLVRASLDANMMKQLINTSQIQNIFTK